MKKFQSIFLFIIMLVSLIPAAGVNAKPQEQTTTIAEIQPGPANVVDLIIQSDIPNTTGSYTAYENLGVGESNAVGVVSTMRTLINFDVSGVPYDMNVVSANLQFTISADNSDAGCVLELYAIKRDFGEDNVNWNTAPGVAWQTPGATGEEDITVLIGTGTIADGSAAVGDVVTITFDDPSFVEEIRRDNYSGFLVKCEVESDNQYLFYSADNAPVDTQRPKLTVEYLPDNNGVDRTSWICEEINSSKCDNAPLSQFPNYNYVDGIETRAPGIGLTFNAATMQCDPYPRCINDYKIHYHIDWKVVWVGGNSTVDANFWINIPGGGINTVWGPNSYLLDEGIDIPCGTNLDTSVCYGTFDGEISTDYLPRFFESDYTIGVNYAIDTNATAVTSLQLEYTVFFSLEPFDQNCADTYYVPQPESYPIDPAIETPLGSLGIPADEQIYTTEIGKTYMIYVDNEWFDGSNPEGKNDTAVSFDGVEWMNWSTFQWYAVCVDAEPGRMEDFDLRIIYFTAQTTTLHIRAGDATGDFADNTTNETDPLLHFEYTIGEALLLASEECGAAFTYDPDEDLLLSVNLLSTFAGTQPVNNASESLHMQVGEWYAIEVASGNWHDAAVVEERIDMEHLFETLTGVQYNDGEFEDLNAEGQFVQCATTNVIYVQAPAELLYLRVNDQDNNFANNTGALGINIYHTAYQRPDEVCELSFALDDLVRSDSVNAQQQNGKAMGIAVGSVLTQQGQEENFFNLGLVPGAWYALETTGGPWGHLGPGRAPAPVHYSLAVAETEIAAANASTTSGPISVIDENAWGPLAEWERGVCNIETDKLGHRMVYFQVPVSTAVQFSLRVNDFEGWNTNTGEMSWNLYRAIDMGPDDSGLCDYSYTEQLNTSVLTVRADAVDGAFIGKDEGIGTPVGDYTPLDPNTYYAIELLGEFWKWNEGPSEPWKTDMQLSFNNGSTWQDLPGGGELCSLEDGENLVFFIHTPVSGDMKQIRLRVASTTDFTDNGGSMGYNTYLAQAGPSIDNTDGCVTEGYTTTTLGPYTWIPVTDPSGIGVSSSSPTTPEIAGLVPGNRYVLETSRGPWYDGETLNGSGNPWDKYSAQVSSDNGATWHAMDGTNPDVTCWEYTSDFKYYKIEFTVQPGQVWRIRVADTESANFDDNTGNLAYTLKGMVLPSDTVVQGTFTLAGCNTPPIFPGMLEIGDLLNLGNYFAEWIDYSVGSMVSFFAWCPSNTDMVTMFAEDLQEKEPFAMLKEIRGILNDVKNEMNGYNWENSTPEDYSILNKTPSQTTAMINQYVMGPLPDDSPWLGGELIDFSAPAPTQYYDNCNLALEEYVGPLLGKGVCFSSNWARNVGLMFYIQLLLDLGIAGSLLWWMKDEVMKIIYIMIGVNLAS